MERVLGIGGYFMRGTDPAALSAWYRDCLGLDADENGLWRQGPDPSLNFGQAGDQLSCPSVSAGAGVVVKDGGFIRALRIWKKMITAMMARENHRP